MIVLVYGLPGTGKTFFAGHFARESGAVHLNTDIVRQKLDARGHYDEKTKQQVYNELYKQVKRELAKDKDVIVDGTFHKIIRRQQIKRMASELEQPVYFIEMKAGDKTVKKRLKKTRKRSEADFEVYKNLEQEYEREEGDHLELWSDNEKVEEMVNKAKAYTDG